MKSFLKFIGGWLFMYFVFAFICLVANWKTMDYADCLNSMPVCLTSFFLGWIGGLCWSIPEDKW